jgi:hypothetical protein
LGITHALAVSSIYRNVDRRNMDRRNVNHRNHKFLIVDDHFKDAKKVSEVAATGENIRDQAVII